MATAEKHKKRSSYRSHIRPPYDSLNSYGLMVGKEKAYRKLESAFLDTMSMIFRRFRESKGRTEKEQE